MEEFLEDLKQRSLTALFPEDLPLEEDLLEVEEQLFLPLPKDYRQFLLEAGNLIFSGYELCTAADSGSQFYLPEIASQAWDQGLPRDTFPICVYRDNLFCMDSGGRIKLWGNGEFTENEWEDIWDWAKDVLAKSAP